MNTQEKNTPNLPHEETEVPRFLAYEMQSK